MRWLLPLLLLAGVAPAEASAGVTASVVVVADGVDASTAACTAQAEVAVEWTRVWCWTDHASAEGYAEGPSAATLLRAYEPLPVEVCVAAEAGYADGRVVTDGPRCSTHTPVAVWPGGECRAFAHPPVAENPITMRADGGFLCDTARSQLSVTVCLEVFETTVGAWEPVDCGAGTAAGTYVATSAWGCRHGLYLTRSAAVGRASTGETARAESTPELFFCFPI